MRHTHSHQPDLGNTGLRKGLLVGSALAFLLLGAIFVGLGVPVSTVVLVAAILAMLLMHTGMMGGHKGH